MKKVLALLFAAALSVSMSSFAFAQATTDKPADSMSKSDSMSKTDKKAAKTKKTKKAAGDSKDSMKKDDMKKDPAK